MLLITINRPDSDYEPIIVGTLVRMPKIKLKHLIIFQAGGLMLCVLYGPKVHHYIIQVLGPGQFQMAHHNYTSVEEIIEFYHKHVIMYSPNQEPVFLGEPFLYPRWSDRCIPQYQSAAYICVWEFCFQVRFLWVVKALHFISSDVDMVFSLWWAPMYLKYFPLFFRL